MPHRILHVVRSLDRYSSAGQALALARSLPADEFQSLTVVLDHAGPLAEPFRAAGLSPMALHRRWTYDPTALCRLIGQIRRLQPALIQTWDADSRRYAELALPWSSSAPLVAQVDELPHSTGLAARLRTYAIRRARCLVSSSDYLRRAVVRQASGDAECRVIAPGVGEPPPSGVTRHGLVEQLQLPADARLIGVACPLMPRYGVRELIWAADMLRVLHPNLRLLIVGDGPQRSHLEQFARTAAEPANICFLGESDLWPELAWHLDVFWQGTEVRATSPTTFLTAMAAGVPVVATNTPQHAEIIDDGVTGYLAPFDGRAEWTRATDQLLTNPELSRTIGKAARQRLAERFSVSRQAAEFAELYRSLLPR